MENQIYHLVYLTTNLVNGKIYVGVHSTYNLEDGYIGSGSGLFKAITKYGKEKFKREILHFCLTREQSLLLEKEIVDEWFVHRSDTYNYQIGGRGGYGLLGAPDDIIKEFKLKASFRSRGQKNNESKSKMSEEKRKNKAIKMRQTRIKNDINMEGSRNPNAKKWKIISPLNEVFIIEGIFVKFCKEHNLSGYSLAESAKNNIICKNGWQAFYI